MNKLQIIGIGGTNGSGKDSVGQILASRHNYLFVSVTDLLRDELKRRSMAVTRQNLRQLSAEWRRESGLGVLVDKALSKYHQQAGRFAGLAIASLRNPGEADRVHQLGGTMLWIDADSGVRYGRIQANSALRDRAGEDNKNFEQFLQEEESEMRQAVGGDNATLNMLGVKERCDVFLENNGNDLIKLQTDLEQVLDL
ncbi:MAG TPA: AAA family ATPase [Candidatus Dormibacteraeota bacterium]|nr:AAA family ATPase [Candidatus Dormibacteraeota bacterium]